MGSPTTWQEDTMDKPGPGLRLRMFIRDSDRWEGKSLYLALLEAAREAGVDGGTVLRGMAGFGSHGRIRTSRIVEISPDLPLVVEIVDTPEQIEAFLPTAERMVEEGLITLDPVTVVARRHRDEG
jgi:PII-like signaling protein